MAPGINNDNFSEASKNNQNDNQAVNERNATSHDKFDDRNKATERDDRDANQTGEPNKKVDNSWDAESKTDNQDEDDWKAENEDAKTSNEGTKNNDWDANDPIERSTRSRNSEEDEVYLSADDYISGDHTDYYLSNDRFRWDHEG